MPSLVYGSLPTDPPTHTEGPLWGSGVVVYRKPHLGNQSVIVNKTEDSPFPIQYLSRRGVDTQGHMVL